MDERLSWPSWLTYSGWLTHISGHTSATSLAQDSESTSAKDQCSTAGPRNQQEAPDIAARCREALEVSVSKLSSKVRSELSEHRAYN